MIAILTYEGYQLVERRSGGWRSIIDGECLNFDSVGQWYQYINILKRKENGKTD